MSSFTSSSDRGPWCRFLGSFLAVAVLAAVGSICCVLAVDPYDTGRFAVFPAVGVPKTDPRTANASRGRDAAFDWAILGNSRSQLLSPERLGTLIGGRFVSLTIPGTGPREQLILARWAAEHHGRDLAGLVIGVDAKWCRKDSLSKSPTPFPDWLYAADWPSYALGMVRWKTLEMTVAKIALLAGGGQAARRDGYDDYESGRIWNRDEAHRRIVETAALESRIDSQEAGERGQFPAIEAARKFLASLPERSMVVFVFNPVFAAALPSSGAPGAASQKACKQDFAEMSGQRRRTALVDYFEDSDLARDEQNFWDAIHYRSRLAEIIEKRIAVEIDATGH